MTTTPPLVSEMGDEGAGAGTPCGGCGAKTNRERCIGCLHDFGTPESSWVRKYHAIALAQGQAS